MRVLVECLPAAGGCPVPAEELLERVWDESADPFTSTVKTRRCRAPATCRTPIRSPPTFPFAAGHTVTSLEVVPIVNGNVDFYNGSSGTIQVVADLLGFYAQ
jgi:hypothetical protein